MKDLFYRSAPMSSADQSTPLSQAQAANDAPVGWPVTRHHRFALTSLKLATYALDAMRVLHRLEAQAQVNESFHQAIRSACPDWRNPGSLEEDPTDLLVAVMMHSLDTLQALVGHLEEACVQGAEPSGVGK